MKIFFTGCIVALALVSKAQDIHFSQFWAAPTIINPAYTGMFDADYRIHASHRTQWNSVSPGVPFRTFGIFADAVNPFGKDIHGGISLYQDKSGDSRFSTLQFNLTGSTHRYLTPDSVHKVSGGAMIGLSQRSISYGGLRFDSQYNGSFYDPSLSSGEDETGNSYAFLNLALGGVYYYRPGGDFEGSAGLSLYNINKPYQSFVKDNAVRLDRRVNLTLQGAYTFNDEHQVRPALNLMSQGKYRELVLGAIYAYKPASMENDITFTGGFFARTRDAGFAVLGVEYENITAGISYDFNWSALTEASHGRGGLELSLVYVFRKFVPEKCTLYGCPPFI